MDNKKTGEIKKNLVKSGIALTAAAGVLIGGLFHSPADLLKDPAEPFDRNIAPAAIELVLTEEDEDPEPDTDGSGGDPEEEAQEEKRGVKESLREMILRMPVGIRGVVFLPLWVIGWLLINGITALWSAVLSPVMSTVLGWICIAGVILLCLVGVVKTAFPNMPLKKILSRKTIIGVLAGVVLCAAADLLLPLVWGGYERLQSILRFAGATAVLGGVSIPFFIKNRKRTEA